jgi:hypothetical protein
MQEGIDWSNGGVIWALSGIAAVFAWLINLVRSMGSSKFADLSQQQVKNTSVIERHNEALSNQETRIAVLERTCIFREDLDKVLESIREELKEEIDDVFSRVHDKVQLIVTQNNAAIRKRSTDEVPYGKN